MENELQFFSIFISINRMNCQEKNIIAEFYLNSSYFNRSIECQSPVRSGMINNRNNHSAYCTVKVFTFPSNVVNLDIIVFDGRNLKFLNRHCQKQHPRQKFTAAEFEICVWVAVAFCLGCNTQRKNSVKTNNWNSNIEPINKWLDK